MAKLLKVEQTTGDIGCSDVQCAFERGIAICKSGALHESLSVVLLLDVVHLHVAVLLWRQPLTLSQLSCVQAFLSLQSVDLPGKQADPPASEQGQLNSRLCRVFSERARGGARVMAPQPMPLHALRAKIEARSGAGSMDHRGLEFRATAHSRCEAVAVLRFDALALLAGTVRAFRN